jgi:hypothetical protein
MTEMSRPLWSEPNSVEGFSTTEGTDGHGNGPNALRRRDVRNTRAIFEVYREMGSGFLEPVYQECLAREFNLRNLPYLAQVELKLTYKGDPLLQTYKPDIL